MTVRYASTLLAAAVLWARPALAQHIHLNAGSTSLEQGSPLLFVNGSGFATNSGYAHPMVLSTNGTYAGLYSGSITFTSLSGAPETGGPAFSHAAFGAVIDLEAVALSGPEGGGFSFWQEDEDTGETGRLFRLPVGETKGTNRLVLSESSGAPGEDPYGHIHGRVFTVDRPGLYTLTVRLYDISTNGANGGPIHQPSEPFSIYFQAGTTIWTIGKSEAGTQLVFGTQTGMTYAVERALALGEGAAWTEVEGGIAGKNNLHFTVDPPAGTAQAFYRLRATKP